MKLLMQLMQFMKLLMKIDQYKEEIKFLQEKMKNISYHMI